MQAIKQQSDDIQLLLERMEEQIKLMLKTYRRNLLQMEVTGHKVEEESNEKTYSHLLEIYGKKASGSWHWLA